MTSTRVLQSYRTERVPAWIDDCLLSVRSWAESKNHDYHFTGDELFELVPDWYLEKINGRLPIATDLARLVLTLQSLEEGFDQVVWFDADTLIFDQSLEINFEGSCAFGQEVWIQTDDNGKLRARKNVHNAVAAFKRNCPVLPFLIQTVTSIIRRADADHISPQMVGPKLITALHNIAGFSLLPEVGAYTPLVLADIRDGGGKALNLMQQKSQATLKAANLCHSLVKDELATLAVKNILNTSG